MVLVAAGQENTEVHHVTGLQTITKGKGQGTILQPTESIRIKAISTDPLVRVISKLGIADLVSRRHTGTLNITTGTPVEGGISLLAVAVRGAITSRTS